jgi:competence protein ComEA
MKMKQYLDEILYMTKAQRNGSVVLIIILFLALIFRILVPVLFQDRTDYSEIIARNMREIDSIYGNNFSNADKQNLTDPYLAEKELFAFDPNTVSNTDLIKLGLSKKTTEIFMNYRNSGAFFYKPEDMLKVYGIDTTIYRQLKPYIQIKVENNVKLKDRNRNLQKVAKYDHLKENNESVSVEKKTTIGREKRVSPIELNYADSALLTTLPGIGPVFASRICKFREYLGGFYSVDQLLQVYNLPEETFQAVKPLLTVDILQIQAININFCTVDELKKHPYCKYKQARAIIDYRAKTGRLKAL